MFAEIELAFETQPLPLSTWIGRDVTGDPRYRKKVLFERGQGTADLLKDLAQDRLPAVA